VSVSSPEPSRNQRALLGGDTLSKDLRRPRTGAREASAGARHEVTFEQQTKFTDSGLRGHKSGGAEGQSLLGEAPKAKQTLPIYVYCITSNAAKPQPQSQPWPSSARYHGQWVSRKQDGDVSAGTGKEASADVKEVDSRSVHVSNVDYSTTPEELLDHFNSCGTINRGTIICDKYTGNPKGFAYIEFQEVNSVANALLLSESAFRERELKVTAKRTNKPGKGKGRGKGKGKGKYGRGRKGGWYSPYW